MSLPSIRECEQRLQSLAEAPASDDTLARAITIGRALLHYVRNAGTQPSAPASPKLQAQSLALRPRSLPMHLVRPAGGAPTDWPSARANKARHDQTHTMAPGQPPARTADAPRPASTLRLPAPQRRMNPRDWMDTGEIAELLGITRCTVGKRVDRDGFPPATERDGRRLLWKRDEVLAWKKQEDEAIASMLDSAGVCRLIGCGRNWLAHRSEVANFPEPARRNGKFLLWTRGSVEAWLAARAAAGAENVRTPHAPTGWLTRVQLCERLRRTDSWIYIAMQSEGFPQPEERIGKHPLWREDKVRAWLDARARQTGRGRARKHFGEWDPRQQRPAATTTANRKEPRA